MITKKKLDQEIQNDHFPNHIAIMMDGNGRWAKQRGLPRTAGHYAGMKTMRKIIRICCKMNLKYLTLYAFSSENWKRPKDEVDYILSLPEQFFDEATLQEFDENNIRVQFLGDIRKFSTGLTDMMQSTVERTKNNDGMILNFAMNYGGRADIMHAMEQIVASGIHPDEITEELFESYLYTEGQPSPELIIRTSGEIRLSNFLLWQSATSELWFTPTYWPDFNQKLLNSAIQEYIERKTRE
ncbi:isoprenyl transferase [Paenibacillus xylanexedens]|uniref:isoprenyl transferase n=1 Tax=Paenibacillus xylanexedens TaxID=528191 RepID=UPI0011A663A1|nr:isoprenyl transferase [Paenibacillus xylanexedens]